MPDWVLCVACGLRHTARPNGVCPRCGQGASLPGPAPPAPRPAAPTPREAPPAPRPGPAVGRPSSACQSCGTPGPTHPVEFRQNVGLVVTRLSRKVAGQLCSDCVERHFWNTTVLTLVAGWWGLISLFVTPVYLLLNLTSYLGAVWALARHAGPTPARDPLGASSLALGVVSLPVLGLGGTVSLAGVGLGLAGLVAPRRRDAPRGPALLGILTNGLCLAMVAALVGLVALARAIPASTRAPRPAAVRPAEGAAAFDAASQRLTAYQDQEAFGNTPQAVEMARRFSLVLRGVSRIAFTGHRQDDTGTFTQGHVLTHVEMRAETVCFLVHVPQLRGYQDDVRGTLLDLAWVAARESTRRARPDRDVKLAVALRGMVFYGAVATGLASGEKPQTREFEGVVPVDGLHAFFEGPPYLAPSPGPEATPTPPPLSTPSAPAPVATPDLRPRVQELRGRLRTGGTRERQKAAADLAELGKAHEGATAAAVPDLLAASRDRDPLLRLFALRALAVAQQERALPALLEALDDPDPKVRAETMWAVVPFCERAQTALPALVRRTRSPTPSDRHAAACVLAVFGARLPAARPEVLAALERLVADPDPLVRHWATTGIEDVKKAVERDSAARPAGR